MDENSNYMNSSSPSSSYDLINANHKLATTKINYDNANDINTTELVDLNKSENSNFKATNDFNLNSNKPKNGNLHDCLSNRKEKKFFSWFKLIINFLVGIPSNKNNESKKLNFLNQRSILGSTLFIITLLIGGLFAVFNIWFAIENGSSLETRNSILGEFTTISLSLIWFLLGAYSNHVLYKIYFTWKLSDAIKGNTKDYFRIPGWIFLFLLVCVFYYCQVDNLKLDPKECDVIKLPIIVCKLKYYTSVVYSAIVIIWSYLAAVTIMMISKTHTYLIRNFLNNIEVDTLNIAQIGDYMMNAKQFASAPDLENFDDNAQAVQEQNLKIFTIFSGLAPKMDNLTVSRIESDLNSNKETLEKSLKESSYKNCFICWMRFNANAKYFVGTSGFGAKFDVNKIKNCPHIMSNSKLLMFYTKIMFLLRETSYLTQRWITNYISWSLLWCTKCLIEFTYQKNPSLTSLFQFILPFLILAVVCGNLNAIFLLMIKMCSLLI